MNKYMKISILVFYTLLLVSCSSVSNDFINTEVNGSFTESIYLPVDKDTDTNSDVIFFDNQVSIKGEYADKNYNISFDMAVTNIINTNIIPYDTKFLCLGISALDNETYYVIATAYDNGNSIITKDKFWVNTENGVVYVYFDPSLSVSEDLAQYKKQIEEDDFRSRLIKVSK